MITLTSHDLSLNQDKGHLLQRWNPNSYNSVGKKAENGDNAGNPVSATEWEGGKKEKWKDWGIVPSKTKSGETVTIKEQVSLVQ